MRLNLLQSYQIIRQNKRCIINFLRLIASIIFSFFMNKPCIAISLSKNNKTEEAWIMDQIYFFSLMSPYKSRQIEEPTCPTATKST